MRKRATPRFERREACGLRQWSGRQGENRVEEISPRLRFRFDDPVTGKALRLEGVSGPGEGAVTAGAIKV